MTKNQLKSLIKECLVEILSEGLGSSAAPILESVKRKSLDPASLTQRTPSLSSVLQQTASRTRIVTGANTRSNSSLTNSTRTERLPRSEFSTIREVIKREAGGDSVMADILADTAVTSLPAMLEGDRSRNAPLPPAGTAERVVASATPDQLFGEEAASKWAALAFMEPVKK